MEEYLKRMAHLAKHGDPNAPCTLKANHGKYQALLKYKEQQKKKSTGQFSISP